MRNTVKALMVISVLLVAIIITGCVQNSDNSVNSNPGNPGAPPGTSGPVQPGNSHLPRNGTPPAGPPSQDLRPRAVPNATVLAAAAGKLGISEQQLEQALTSPAGTRQNLTIAAQQLNISPQQLAEALGIPSGFPMQRGNRTGPMTGPGS